MKRNAFGAIDFLITLLVITAIFMLGMNSLKNSPTLMLDNKNSTTIKEQVDKQVNEIEQIRGQSIQYQKEQLAD